MKRKHLRYIAYVSMAIGVLYTFSATTMIDTFIGMLPFIAGALLFYQNKKKN